MEEMKAREDEQAAARKQVHIGEFVLSPPQQGVSPGWWRIALPLTGVRVSIKNVSPLTR